MARPKTIEVKKILSKKQLNKKIRKLETETEVLNKLHFIRHLYNKKSIQEAAELEEISISTAYSWVNRWNENGIDGLKTKPRSGKPGSLSEEDKEKLDILFFETKFLTTEKAHKIIKDNFGLDFTFKHVRTILHQLDYYYSQPYTKFKESDEEKRKEFKKETRKLNKDKQIIGSLDQTYCDKNAPPKTLHKKGTKNRLEINGKRIHQTAMAFQAFNGASHVAFPDNSRSHNMMLFVAELRMKNLINDELKQYIDCAIHDSSVNRMNMVSEYNFQTMGVELINNKITNIGKSKGYKKTFIKKVNKLVFGERENTDFAIDKQIRDQLLENLECMNIGSLMEDEKEIVIILDNYRPHHNSEFRKFCKLLKIKLIYIPPYTPQYNPIEQVWKSIKRIIYDPTISTREELIKIFEEEFYRIIYNESFYKKWEEKFLL